MPRTARSHPEAGRAGAVQIVPPEYSGRWVAWTRDGCRIVASGATLKACEASVSRARFAPDQITFDRIPAARRRPPGPAFGSRTAK
jgi:hypothetical protein